MKKRNNKGFTLIELLVAIALTLTILGIAIVSFISVSDRKKEEAWENVKSQIETAAEQYFKSNEYLFEGFASGSSGTISVGKLVSEDYLNSVTNPITGKKVSYCTLVTVTNNNGVFTTKVDDSTEQDEGNNDSACPSGNSIVISEVGAPKLSPEVLCGEDGENGWCKRSDAGVKIKANTDEDGNGTIVSTKYAYSPNDISRWPEGEVGTEGEEYNTDTSTKGSTVCFRTTNSKGKTAEGCATYKLDMDLPTIDYSISSNSGSYHSNEINILGSAKDTTSGLSSVKRNDEFFYTKFQKGINESDFEYKQYSISNTLDGKSYSLQLKAIDMAGNESNPLEKQYTVYDECSQTVVGESQTGSWSSCSSECGGGTRTRSKINVLVDAKTGAFCKNEPADEERESCNEQACDTYVCPSITDVDGKEGNNGWYVSKVKFEITAKDKTTKWHWLTDNACDPSKDSNCINIDGTNYKDWSEHTGNQNTEISGNGTRSVIIGYYDSEDNFYTCDKRTVKVDTVPPNVTWTDLNSCSCSGYYGVKGSYNYSDVTSKIYFVRDIYGHSSNESKDTFLTKANRADSDNSYTAHWSGACQNAGDNTPDNDPYYHKVYAEDNAGNWAIYVTKKTVTKSGGTCEQSEVPGQTKISSGVNIR